MNRRRGRSHGPGREGTGVKISTGLVSNNKSIIQQPNLDESRSGGREAVIRYRTADPGGVFFRPSMREPKRSNLIPAWPELFLKEVVATLFGLSLLILLGLFLRQSEEGDRGSTFIMIWIQELLIHFDPIWAYLIFPISMTLLLILLPLTENLLFSSVSSRRGTFSRWAVFLICVNISIPVLLTILYKFRMVGYDLFPSSVRDSFFSVPPEAGLGFVFLSQILPFILYLSVAGSLVLLPTVRKVTSVRGMKRLYIPLTGILFAIILLIPLKIILTIFIPCKYLIYAGWFRL